MTSSASARSHASTRRTSASSGLAWFADFDINRGQEATPLAIDGVLYVSTAWSKVKAYDARTGAPALGLRSEGARRVRRAAAAAMS